MILNTTHELYFDNNDIFQMQSCADKIIVNEDYHGIRILDLSLNTIKIIPLMERLVILSFYKKYDNSSVAIYAPEQNRLIFVDLQTFTHFTVELLDPLTKYYLDRNYYWQDNTLIFGIENRDIFYQFDFEFSMLKKISQKTVRSIAPSFLDFWQACKKYDAITIYPDQSSFTYKKNRKLTGFYDYKNNGLILTKHSLKLFDEVYYHNKMFIFSDLWNKNINIHNKIFFSGASSYYCLRISNLDNGNIAVLYTNRDDHRYCFLQIWEINNTKK